MRVTTRTCRKEFPYASSLKIETFPMLVHTLPESGITLTAKDFLECQNQTAKKNMQCHHVSMEYSN
jgi:hypothetical protein